MSPTGAMEHESEVAGVLRDRLADAAPGPALRALAAVDPAAAARFLVQDAGTAGLDLDPSAVREIVSALVEAGGTEVLDESTMRAVLEAHGEFLSPDVLGRLALPLSGDGETSGAADLLDEALDRHPRHPDLLRSAAVRAMATGRYSEAHELLTRLGRADRRQATLHWIRRKREELPEPDAPPVRLALLSSFTVDPLVPYVDLECRALGLAPEVHVAPFNSWAREIIDEGSDLRAFEPEITFLSVSIDDLIPQLSRALSADTLEEKGRDAVEHVVGLAGRFRQWSDGLLVVHGFVSAHRDPFGVAAGHGAPDRTAWMTDLNQRLRDELGELQRTHYLDMKELLLRRSGGPLDNPKARHLARMRLVDAALAEVARAYARYIAPVKGLTRKCVVVDLDNTLWGGVVGEVGASGIQLGSTSPGSEYVEFQEYLHSLTERGILLAVNSKNNPDDALEPIRSHDAMVLREDSFNAMRINWTPKHQNMKSIADELDIGLDSLVFVDDNPHERELMRQMLPEVLTPEMPEDPTRYRRTLEMLPQLQSLVLTEVDRMRVQQYRAKRERREFRDDVGSMEDYLASLNIRVEAGLASEDDLPRIAQLFQRTNQFNLTVRRYDAGELSAFMEGGDHRLYMGRAQDRFGKHGLVSTALVRSDADEWVIDNFLLSCRVIGYGVETALLSVICRDARRAGVTSLRGELVPTDRNEPARDLYLSHGFQDAGEEDGVHGWTLSPGQESVSAPDWIELVRPDGT